MTDQILTDSGQMQTPNNLRADRDKYRRALSNRITQLHKFATELQNMRRQVLSEAAEIKGIIESESTERDNSTDSIAGVV